MIEHPRILVLVVVASLAGVLSLYAYSVSIEPDEMGISELASGDVGRYVRVQGYVSGPRSTSTGDVKLTLEDMEGNALTAFVESNVVEGLDGNESLVPGSLVALSGTVEEYEGELEIRVSNPEGYELLEPAGKRAIPLADLLAWPELYDGMVVSTVGEAWGLNEGYDGTEFTLQNATDGYLYSLACEVEGWDWLSDERGFEDGVETRATGSLDYRSTTGRWVLECEGDWAVQKI